MKYENEHCIIEAATLGAHGIPTSLVLRGTDNSRLRVAVPSAVVQAVLDTKNRRSILFTVRGVLQPIPDQPPTADIASVKAQTELAAVICGWQLVRPTVHRITEGWSEIQVYPQLD